MSPERLSVLHVIPELPVGGAETLVFQMARGLDRARFAPAVAVLGALGPMGAEMRAAGLEVVALERFGRPFRLARLLPALAALMRERRVRIVHTHLYHANYYGRLAALLAPVPVRVASVHNLYDRVKPHRRWANRWLGERTQVVLAGSARVRADILRWDGIPAARVRVLPYGIDLAPYGEPRDRGGARAALGLPSGAPVIGTVGRLEPQKGHDLLLEAFARLRRERPEARLLLVGDGRERAALEGLAARLGVAEGVRFLGTRRDLPALLPALDAFAFPSRWEGTPLALIAAMAAGVPVVATPVGGVPTVVEEGRTGRLVPVEDVPALAAALGGLLDDPAASRSLAERGRAHVLAHCSVEAMVGELEALYLELAAAAGMAFR